MKVVSRVSFKEKAEMIPETIIDSELDKPKSVQEWLEKNEKRNRARRKILVSITIIVNKHRFTV